MSRSAAWLAIGALTLGACSGDDVVVDDTPSVSASPVEAGASSAPPVLEPDPLPSPTESATDDRSDAELLDRLSADELAMGLVVVDPATGAVSWFNGFEFLTFDVDAALDATAWAMDGAGGVLLQSADRGIWHLPEPSDDPELILSGPGEDYSVTQELVGGGLLDGSPQAYLESGTVDMPENTSADLVAVDLDSGKFNLVQSRVTGWESGLADASVVGDDVLLTVYAEGYVIVVADNLADGTSRTFTEAEQIEVHSALDPAVSGAWLLMENDDFSGWTLVRRDLVGDGLDVFALPDHDQRYVDLSVFEGTALATGDELTLVRPSGQGWKLLDVDLPGFVMLAPGFALG